MNVVIKSFIRCASGSKDTGYGQVSDAHIDCKHCCFARTRRGRLYVLVFIHSNFSIKFHLRLKKLKWRPCELPVQVVKMSTSDQAQSD
jgi:hypothetical protein